jgi:hypothetical protein
MRFENIYSYHTDSNNSDWLQEIRGKKTVKLNFHQI